VVGGFHNLVFAGASKLREALMPIYRDLVHRLLDAPIAEWKDADEVLLKVMEGLFNLKSFTEVDEALGRVIKDSEELRLKDKTAFDNQVRLSRIFPKDAVKTADRIRKILRGSGHNRKEG
jgi:hypothetical protein